MKVKIKGKTTPENIKKTLDKFLEMVNFDAKNNAIYCTFLINIYDKKGGKLVYLNSENIEQEEIEFHPYF